jgi:transposase
MRKEERALLEPMTTARVYVGVDVSKDRLDVCVRRGEAQRHNDTSFVVAHEDAGFETLLSRLLEERPELVIVEATGGFERAVVATLAAEGLPQFLGAFPNALSPLSALP